MTVGIFESSTCHRSQAAINGEDLATALTDSLEELCEDIAHWRKQVLAHRAVPSMQRDVRAL